jgi:hypothetical protein
MGACCIRRPVVPVAVSPPEFLALVMMTSFDPGEGPVGAAPRRRCCEKKVRTS